MFGLIYFFKSLSNMSLFIILTLDLLMLELYFFDILILLASTENTGITFWLVFSIIYIFEGINRLSGVFIIKFLSLKKLLSFFDVDYDIY